MTNKPVLLAISGVKNSGKTTLIEKLIPILSAKGIKTAVIKHDGHSYVPDVPGTDSHRFFTAGACASAIFDGEKYTVTRRAGVSEAFFPDMFPEAGLILLEGFKNSDYPKIELVRSGVSKGPVCDENTCIAYVSDIDYPFPKPVFRPDELMEIADFISGYMKGDKGHA